MRVCLQCGKSTDGLFCPTDGMATIVADRKPTTTELVPQSIFASRYRILGTLGRGGMGAVYDAQHTGTGQRVAIKTLLLDTAQEPQAVRRFFMEAKLTASLQHPNTIKVFDFGQSDDGVFFLAMERLQGETLGERLTRYQATGERMTEQEAAHIAVAVLRSLAEAHRVGLVHRDLKPGNIFVHDLGGGETMVKVLDFGIAKNADTQLTATGTSLGTPAYMSPEQVMGGELDGRSDLYSLGVVLYQCVAGRVPFHGDSSYTVMIKQVHEPAPDLEQLASVTEGFSRVVAQALAKTPPERYADATAMREALEGHLQGRVQAPSAINNPGAARLTPAAANLSTGSAPAPADAGPSAAPHQTRQAKAPQQGQAPRPEPAPPRRSPPPAQAPAAGQSPPPPPPAVAAPVAPGRATRSSIDPPKGSTSRVPLFVAGAAVILAGAAAALLYLKEDGEPAAGAAGAAANEAAVAPATAGAATGLDAGPALAGGSSAPADAGAAPPEVAAPPTEDIAVPLADGAAVPAVPVADVVVAGAEPDAAAATAPEVAAAAPEEPAVVAPLDPPGGGAEEVEVAAPADEGVAPVKPKPKAKPVIKKTTDRAPGSGGRAGGGGGGGRAGGAGGAGGGTGGRAPR